MVTSPESVSLHLEKLKDAISALASFARKMASDVTQVSCLKIKTKDGEFDAYIFIMRRDTDKFLATKSFMVALDQEAEAEAEAEAEEE